MNSSEEKNSTPFFLKQDMNSSNSEEKKSIPSNFKQTTPKFSFTSFKFKRSEPKVDETPPEPEMNNIPPPEVNVIPKPDSPPPILLERKESENISVIPKGNPINHDSQDSLSFPIKLQEKVVKIKYLGFVLIVFLAIKNSEGIYRIFLKVTE